MEFYERREPLEAMVAAHRRATTAHGEAVVVRGEAGIGKTSLIRAFLETENVAPALGRCDDTSVPRPLGPFRDIFRADEIDVAFDDAEAVRLAMAEVLDRHRVVILEDIHWADEASLDLIAHTCRRVGDHDALIVVTHRPDESPKLARCLAQIPPDLSTDLSLEPLSRDTVVAWAEQHDRDGDAIHEAAGGNPFLVSELLDAPPGAIPDRVSTTTHARFAQLSAQAQSVAEQISVFPGGALWRDIDELAPDNVDAVGELERHRWLRADHDVIRFRHELIRRAIVEWLPQARRRQLHRAALDVLIERSADPAPIAHHAAEAGDDQRSIDYAVMAALELSRAGAHRDALTHLERVAHLVDLLEIEERAQFAEAIGMERLTADQIEGALDALLDAYDRWHALGDVENAARSLSQASTAAWRLARIDESLDLQRRAMRTLEGTEHREQLFRSRVALAQAVGMRSRWRAADVEIGRALADTDGVPEDALAVGYAVRADVRRLLGQRAAALTDYERAIELAEPLSPARMLMLTNRAATSLAALDIDTAAEHVAAAKAATTEVQSIHNDRFVTELEAGVALERGEWDVARELAERLGDDPSAIRVRPFLIRGLIAARRGEPVGVELIRAAHERAMDLADIQRLGGVGVALAELVWLGAVDDAAPVEEIARLAHTSGHARFSAELGVWCRRLGLDDGPHEPDPAGPRGFGLELAGNPTAAADEWAQRGVPHLQVLALAFSTEPADLRRGIDGAVELGATATADRIRARLRELGHAVTRGRGRTTLGNPGGLTRRQLDVVRLLGDGLTNQEIADRLYISPKTVDHHVSAILTTLGVDDRAAAGAWARSADLG